MNSKMMKRVTTGLAAISLLTVVSAQAAAAQYDYARVISSEPIIRVVTVNRPVRECWQETEYYTVDRPVPGSGASTLVGAIIGGVVGHQFGSGRGNDAATVAGTVIGAAIGNDAAKRRYGASYRTVEYSRPTYGMKNRFTSTRASTETVRVRPSVWATVGVTCLLTVIR